MRNGTKVRNVFWASLTGLLLPALLASAGCSEDLTGPTPEFSGEPGAEEESNRLVQPAFTCNEQLEENWVEVRGKNFAPLVAEALDDPNVEMPTVTLKRSEELDVHSTGERTQFTFGEQGAEKQRLRWHDQETIELLIDPELNLQPGIYDLTVENPQGETASREQAFGLLPRPVVESVEPQRVCNSDETQTVSVSGGPFLQNPDGEVTETRIGSGTYGADAIEASSCEQFEEGPFSGWSICSQFDVDVPLEDYEPGLHRVSATNLEPAHCESDADDDRVDFRVIRRPVVDSVQPSPICTQQNTYTVSVNGENFVFDDGTAPTVTLGGNEVEVVGPEDPTNADACQPHDDLDGVYFCSQLQVDTGQEGLLHQDDTVTSDDVVVDNPPGDLTCQNDEPGTIRNAPPPRLNEAQIFEGCGDTADRLVVEGKYHFSMGNRMPEMTLTDPSGNEVNYTPEDLRGNNALNGECSGNLEDTSEPTEHCTVSNFALTDETDVSEGEYALSYTNPEAVQCNAEETFEITPVEAEPPVIDGVQEDAICSLGDTLTIEGENFKMGAEVDIDGDAADSVTVSDDGTTIEATWMDEVQASEQPTLNVTNPDSCAASLDIGGAVELVEGPIAIFLDPSIHFNEIEIRGTLYSTGGTSRDISTVQIRNDGTVRDLQFDDPDTTDNQVSPILPDEDPANAGMFLPAGDYDVRLTEEVTGTECGAWIDDLLTVTDEKNLQLESIEPEYGWEQESTSVRMTAAEMGELGMNETQFEPTPRAYLSPSSASGTTAVELGGVSYNDGTEINGIVPTPVDNNLSTGTYTLVVINPDDTVGVLQDAFTITQDPPPEIDNVSPSTWRTGRTLTVDVTGDHFRSPQVDVTCEGTDPSSVTVQSDSATDIELEVDTNGMDNSDACVLTVTNMDGTFDSISPITTVNPAQNFLAFEGSGSNNWNEARRWPAMSSGEASSQQRFVYTLGGDDGDANNPKPAGEFAQIDRFGNLQEWNFLPNNLPGNGRTLARAERVRDFIYLVGGNDGNNATDTIHRANVLDPEHVPEIDDLDFNFADASGDGLDPGVYYYRVSAVHDSNSEYNPGGETLASNIQPVSIPDLSGRFAVQVELSWNAGDLSNVDEFRVYRTENPNETVGDEKLLETFPAGTTSFTDDVTDSGSFSSDQPLPVGSLGTWHDTGETLSQARQKHGLQAVVDPNDPTNVYIYALGGEDDSNTPLDSIERITIQDSDPSTRRSQTITDVSAPGDPADPPTMTSERTEVEALAATPTNSDVLAPGTGYLYAAQGSEATGAGTSGTTTVDSWEILFDSGGDLGTRRSETNTSRKRAGHVGTIGSTFAFMLGGHRADLSSNVDKSGDPQSEVGMTSTGGIGSWQSPGSVQMDPRYQFGGAAFVGFFYIGGGDDGSGGALNTVEYSIVGSTLR